MYNGKVCKLTIKRFEQKSYKLIVLKMVTTTQVSRPLKRFFNFYVGDTFINLYGPLVTMFWSDLVSETDP